MRKLLFCFLTLALICIAFGACSDGETYADMLESEKKDIASFIRDSNITVISQSEFFKKDSTTDVSKNEYVQLSSGVYMQIVDKGSSNPADTVRSNDYVLIRYQESHIMRDSSYVSCTNLPYPTMVDKFRYKKIGTTAAGILIEGMLYATYQATSIPSAWIIALDYVRDGGRVKLIVPSKMGHETAIQYVYPYYYDIRKFQFYR